MRSVQKYLLPVVAIPLLAGWGWPRPQLRPLPHVPAALRLPRPLPSRIVDVPILLYHRIAPRAAGLPGLTVTPTDFAAEMEWLHGAGFHAITQRQLFAALEHGRPLPARPVMITFDDGYRDVLWNAAPILHRLHMPATAYVITARVNGGDPSFLSWPELGRLQRLGFDIGSHTVDHADLTGLPSLRVYVELRSSRRALEAHLGRPVQWVSYPFGRADVRVADVAAAAGYVLGVTEVAGSAQHADAPLLLRRDRILPSTGVAGVRALVESASG